MINFYSFCDEDYQDFREIYSIKDSNPIRAACFNNDGNAFAIGTNSKSLKIYSFSPNVAFENFIDNLLTLLPSPTKKMKVLLKWSGKSRITILAPFTPLIGRNRISLLRQVPMIKRLRSSHYRTLITRYHPSFLLHFHH